MAKQRFWLEALIEVDVPDGQTPDQTIELARDQDWYVANDSTHVAVWTSDILGHPQPAVELAALDFPNMREAEE